MKGDYRTIKGGFLIVCHTLMAWACGETKEETLNMFKDMLPDIMVGEYDVLIYELDPYPEARLMLDGLSVIVFDKDGHQLFIDPDNAIINFREI